MGIPLLGGNLTANDVKFYGFSDSSVTSLSSNITNTTFALNATFSYPIILLTGDFDFELNLGPYSFNLTGPVNITLKNVNVDFETVGATQNINGTDYMVVQSVNFVPHPESINISTPNVGETFFQKKIPRTFS